MATRDRTLTPRAVRSLIAEGHSIVIFEDSVLKLDSWLEKHPGGQLAIKHMIGRDATDEIKVNHSAATLKTMKAFRIGRKLAGPWTNMTPPIRGGVFVKEKDEEEDYPPSSASDTDTDLDTADDSISLASDRSSLTSSTSLTADSVSHLRQRRLPIHFHDAELPAEGKDEAHGNVYAMSAAEYTEFAVQQNVEESRIDYPSLDAVVQQDIVRRYRALHQRVEDEGLYDCPYVEYGKEMIRYTALFAAFMGTLYYGWYMTSAVFLGFFWQQIMFTAHDAGHRAITHNFVVDTLIGIFIADFCCGLSIGWWKSSHNVHHLVTNAPDHDPDIQNTPLFAIAPQFFRNIVSSYYGGFVFYWDAFADFMIPIQKYTYYPIMAVARFNLYMLSWLHVLSKRSSGLGTAKWIRPTEIAFMTIYWYFFGYLLLWCSLPDWKSRVAFVLVSHIATFPLHVQITLSHWGMSTSDLGESESFPQRQLRTTMDVDCPKWLDFFHGGLQFQAVHHLFPRMPRHNLRKAQVLVREFCRDTNIPYSILGFVDGNRYVLSHLDQISDQVRILINCQKHMAKTGESGLH
ncbi:Uu.00g027020.m01.CDS01 [Anthostomella pinea]|uniref:Delta 8-(E)-sphingolipid desaturase n=1 Tax=Anthostomella pinea TaxID=933095 RepID=A0AAI8V7L8_9PEZI|nr:Uu.00g027020.m01.CDS01 [Anthostomella pinea]